MLTLTKFFDKNIYIYRTKNIHCEKSNDIDSVL
jgi:predicted nucleic acid-binding protein